MAFHGKGDNCLAGHVSPIKNDPRGETGAGMLTPQWAQRVEV